MNGLKIAISGKGGVGKSTLAAALCLLLSKKGNTVLAVDADPDANLATALGMSLQDQKSIIPISQRISLIEERTGAKVKQYGQMFKLNPHVADIADTCSIVCNGVSLLVLGAVDRGGGGCACPENIFIRSLVTDLVLNRNEILIMDMEAGVEHLGRATVSGVDIMLIVLEPGQRSVESTRRILSMAREIKMPRIALVANKVNGPDDLAFIKAEFPDQEIIGCIPYTDSLRLSDRSGHTVLDNADQPIFACFNKIVDTLKSIRETDEK